MHSARHVLQACGLTRRFRLLLRFAVDEQFRLSIIEADKVGLRNVEKIAGRFLPKWWQEITARSVSRGKLGFELICDVDAIAES